MPIPKCSVDDCENNEYVKGKCSGHYHLELTGKPKPGSNGKYHNKWRAARRKKLYEAYGGKCAMCGCECLEEFDIDHVFENSIEHRVYLGIPDRSGDKITDELTRRKFPNDFPFLIQILCVPCHRNKTGLCKR